MRVDSFKYDPQKSRTEAFIGSGRISVCDLQEQMEHGIGRALAQHCNNIGFTAQESEESSSVMNQAFVTFLDTLKFFLDKLRKQPVYTVDLLSKDLEFDVKIEKSAMKVIFKLQGENLLRVSFQDSEDKLTFDPFAELRIDTLLEQATIEKFGFVSRDDGKEASVSNIPIDDDSAVHPMFVIDISPSWEAED